jgi:uncharacterized protein (DUF1015 family)
MPAVYPFAAVQYKSGSGDVSTLVAPPYDVLDAAGKQKLLARDPNNVVAIDLPHTPAKELGPPAAYDGAAGTYQAWLKSGSLSRRGTPAMFAYRQTFQGSNGSPVQRSGMAVTVDAVPFGPRAGGGVLPHEETFSGPKEDRFALMKATKCQLSPIFGLFADESGAGTRVVKAAMTGKPSMTATTADGTLHEVWTVADGATIKSYQDALAGQDIFIADGHHRYTTGLNYIKHLESQGTVPAAARRSMMVLVGMSDPGLVIWPTHRVLGGMKGYTIEAFITASKGMLKIDSAGSDLKALEQKLAAAKPSTNVLGLYDFSSKRCFVATMDQPDPLKERFAAKPREWRELDVALIQYVVVEQICQPKLNGGQPVKWAFPHTIQEVLDIGSGAETGAGGGTGFAQLAVIVRPTPLEAVRAVSRANELMPQKSTFFYPKLATGLWLNPLE